MKTKSLTIALAKKHYEGEIETWKESYENLMDFYEKHIAQIEKDHEKEIADLKAENEKLEAIAFGVCVYCDKLSEFESRLKDKIKERRLYWEKRKHPWVTFESHEITDLISETRKEMEHD
jgi:hypothetical protein